MKKSIAGILSAATMLATLMVWYSCTKDSEVTTGGIYGTVTDYATGEPVGNANVKLKPTGETTLTGSDGTYEFKDLDPKNYSLQLSKAEYADLDDDYVITVEAGKKAKRDVQMRKKIASLKIRDMNGEQLDTLDFGSEESVTVRTFNVYNDGTEELECRPDFGECSWILTVTGLENTIHPGQTKTASVKIDRVALVDGINTTFLNIISNNGSNEIVVKATFVGTTVISTANATNVTASSVTVGGEITDDGGRPVLERGICYSTSQSPDINGDHTQDGSGTGTFSHNITGLTASTTYYARAYATNRNGTYYASNIVSFTTENGLPTVTTAEVTDITGFTAKSGGNVTSNGGFNVTARGICWNTLGSPDLSDAHTTNGNGNGTFISNLTNLDIGTTYFVRAYATNDHGTSFGEEKTFSTPAGNVTIDFPAPTNVTAQSATCSASITDNGGLPVASRGFCWATTQYPTINGQHVDLGMGGGNFTSTIIDLLPATTYYVRAYVNNAAGTTYSTQHSFTTTNGLPTLTTTTVTNITATSAQCGGTISDNGGFPITARGICWNTMGNPDLNGNHTTNGTGNGTFTANMTNLTPSTTYHVRAYATNNTGTVYGNELTFTTSDGLPTVSTGTVSNITATTAVCSGSVISDGGVAITAKGFCWGTTQYPTISGNHSNEGGGTGAFNSSLTNLSISTTYYVRAYATNTTGTVYGEQVSFTTNSGLPIVSTTSPTINGNTVSTGGNVSSDGGFPVTARGVCYGALPNPDLTGTHSHTVNGSGTGYFSSQFSLPNGSGTYYVRAYATNANGTVYGEQMTITTAYDTLPTFSFNGHTYKVAPDASSYMWWTDANTYCNNLTFGGYSDWRLPTKEELYQMYNSLGSMGFFLTDRPYWSSSYPSSNNYYEEDYGGHYHYYNSVDFSNGQQSYQIWFSSLYVRPVRIEQ